MEVAGNYPAAQSDSSGDMDENQAMVLSVRGAAHHSTPSEKVP